jgi:hypothetical protein
MEENMAAVGKPDPARRASASGSSSPATSGKAPAGVGSTLSTISGYGYSMIKKPIGGLYSLLRFLLNFIPFFRKSNVLLTHKYDASSLTSKNITIFGWRVVPRFYISETRYINSSQISEVKAKHPEVEIIALDTNSEEYKKQNQHLLGQSKAK